MFNVRIHGRIRKLWISPKIRMVSLLGLMGIKMCRELEGPSETPSCSHPGFTDFGVSSQTRPTSLLGCTPVLLQWPILYVFAIQIREKVYLFEPANNYCPWLGSLVPYYAKATKKNVHVLPLGLWCNQQLPLCKVSLNGPSLEQGLCWKGSWDRLSHEWHTVLWPLFKHC